MNAFELNSAMEAKLQTAGIGFETIKVFGVIRQNVHVKCVSRDTADKWVQLLAAVFHGAKVSCTATVWNAADNKGSNLAPTMRKGWLIAVAP